MMNKTTLLLGSLLCTAGCVNSAPSETPLQGLASQLGVKYQVIDTVSQTACREAGIDSDCFSADVTLTLPATLPDTDWEIRFSHVAPVEAVTSDDFTVTHINGDLHALNPTGSLTPGDTLEGTLHALFWHVSRSDVIPNWYLVAPDAEPVTIEATRAIIDPVRKINIPAHAGDWTSRSQNRRSATDNLPLADSEWLYEHYAHWADSRPNSTPRVIPDVGKIEVTGDAIPVKALAITLAAGHPARSALQDAGIKLGADGFPVRFEESKQLTGSAYQMTIDSDGVKISAASESARHYALLTLAQLYQPEQQTLPAVRLADEPTYSYRGMHVDIARNYPGKDVLFELVEQMYRVKLNKLHLHLADDEGWRLEIKEYPELTDIGSRRCESDQEDSCLIPQLGSGPNADSSVNGYLTASDYKTLVQYAAERNIEVIPSIDMPGHARAAIKSMQARQQMYPQSPDLVEEGDTTVYRSIQFYNDNTLNPCIADTYEFADTVISRIQQMHDDAGVPLKVFHMGADETGGAWVNSPACEAMLGQPLTQEMAHQLLGHFVEKVQQLTNKKGLVLGGWSDGMSMLPEPKRTADTLVTVWTTLPAGGENTVTEWQRSDSQIVLSFPDVLYFDFPYQNHPEEPGYYWGSKNTDLFKVFQFTPDVLPVHQYLWTDRMGKPFTQNSEQVASSEDIAGIQGQIWTEVIRSPETLEYMIYPRLFALAERAWSPTPWAKQATEALAGKPDAVSAVKEQQYAGFSAFAEQLVSYQLKQLADRQVNFRLPPPGVKVESGTVNVNAAYPGLGVAWSADNKQWQPVTKELTLMPEYFYRTFLPGTDKVSASIQPVKAAARKQ